MRLTEKDGLLEYVLEGNETKEEIEFYNTISNLILTRQGATIFAHDKNTHQLAAYFKPFDNTQLICTEAGYALANAYGAKRFLLNEATDAKPSNASTFKRDRSFSLDEQDDASNIPFKVVDLTQLLALYKTNKEDLYNHLAKLFNLCADFTPGKQEEYAQGGAKADKFCRFNLENNPTYFNFFNDALTEHVFLLDKNNQVIGTISASLIFANNQIDIYFYDEAVNYLSFLPEDTQKKIHILSDQLRDLDKRIKDESDENKKTLLEKERDQLKKEFYDLTETKRVELLGLLFRTARDQIKKIIERIQHNLSLDETNKNTNERKIHAFIRVAAERESSYEKLNCGKENKNIYVIHGPRTTYAERLDLYLKEWAKNELEKIAVKVTSISSTAFSKAPVNQNASQEIIPKNNILEQVEVAVNWWVNQLETGTGYRNSLSDTISRRIPFETMEQTIKTVDIISQLSYHPNISAEQLKIFKKVLTEELTKKVLKNSQIPEERSILLHTDNSQLDPILDAAIKASGIFALYLPNKAMMRLYNDGYIHVRENYLTDQKAIVLREEDPIQKQTVSFKNF